jgi:hypothetical protein
VLWSHKALGNDDNALRFRGAGNTGAERDVHGHGGAAVGQQRADRYGYVPGWDDDAGNGNFERGRGSNVEYKFVAGGDAVDHGFLRGGQ